MSHPLSNAYPGLFRQDTYAERLKAAKMALKCPGYVERLESGLGWRIKPDAPQLVAARYASQSGDSIGWGILGVTL